MARTEIQVFPFSEVPAEQPVRLGLIAGPVANGPSAFEKIEDIEIFPARKSGDRYFLGRVEIARVLQDKISSSDREFSFRIPNQVIILTKHNMVSPHDVARKILARLSELCAECRVSLHDLRVPEIQTTEVMTGWEIDDSQTTLKGAVLLPLKAKFQNGSQQTFWINVRILQEKNVIVARKDLKMGDHLSKDDYEMKWMDVTFLRESPMKESEAADQILNKYVMAGHLITAGDMKKEPAALRGQQVKVIAGGQDLEVTVSAVAEDQGAVGDMIRIKIQDSQKLISGKLIEKGVVRIQ